MGNLTVRAVNPTDSERLTEIYRNAYRETRNLGFPATAENVMTDDIEAWRADGELG